MPSWEKLYREVSQGSMRFVSVAVRDTKAELRRISAEKSLSFPILMDEEGEGAGSFGVRAVPTFILLDKEGRIAARFVGPKRFSKDELERLVE